MNVIIVDDSRLARAELRTLLGEHPDVQVVAEADDVPSAVAALRRHPADLLLLDIQLPSGTGFDVLEQAGNIPQVVFTTAYDQYAVRAFENNALDYLLKPVATARLAEALQRCREKISASSDEEEGKLSAEDTVFLRDGERCWFVCLREISHLVVDGNYTRVSFRNESALLNRSLSALEARLDPTLFLRANRNTLVNLRAISVVDPWINDGYRIRMKDGSEFEISRRQGRELRERMAL